MFSQYDSEEHKEKAEKVILGLGEFVMAFERVCASLRMCIICIFQREGLKNQGLAQVVVNGEAPSVLITLLGTLYSELRDQDEDDRKCVDELLGKIRQLSQKRNGLLHSEWHLNSNYEGANEKFLALALRTGSSKSKGAFYIPQGVSRDYLDRLTHEATEVLVLLRRLTVCMNQKGFKVSRQFERPL